MENIFPLITAHSGCMQTPPNSLEYIVKGAEAGADILEVDVNATQDGVPVLFHDQHIWLSPHQNVRVYDLTFEELQKARMSQADQKILRLEDVLDRVQSARKVLNLDLKSPACVKPMAEAVKFRNMVDNVILSGCDRRYAVFMKKHYPDFQVLLNADDFPSNGVGYEEYTTRTCRDAITASCCGINIHYKDYRPEMLLYARLRCLPVLIYTVDNFEDMKTFAMSGVHSITTNNVATLVTLKGFLSLA